MPFTILVFLLITVGVSVYVLWKQKRDRAAPVKPSAVIRPVPTHAERASVEDQVAAFAKAGLHLNPGVRIDDVIYSFDAPEFAQDRYNLLLFVYGIEIEREPWGRRFCDQVLNFDYERIGATGDYVKIAQDLAALTGRTDLISEARDTVDLEKPTATLTCRIAGVPKTYKIKIKDDWADPDVVLALLKDIELAVDDGRTFWSGDNGQSAIYLFISDETATALQALKDDCITRVIY